MRAGTWYTLASLAALALVGAVGSSMVESVAARGAVWSGGVAGAVVQVATFWLLFVWWMPHRHALAHGLGMLVRFAAVAGAALVWVPVAGLDAGPALLALVGTLSLTTLVEPVILRLSATRTPGPRGGGAVAGTTT